jgi:hypothetical protein
MMEYWNDGRKKKTEHRIQEAVERRTEKRE